MGSGQGAGQFGQRDVRLRADDLQQKAQVRRKLANRPRRAPLPFGRKAPVARYCATSRTAVLALTPNTRPAARQE